MPNEPEVLQLSKEEASRVLAANIVAGLPPMRPDAAAVVIDAIAKPVARLMGHVETFQRKAANLLSENAALRDLIAGQARAQDGGSLEEQVRVVQQLLREINVRCENRSLRSVMLIWDEGKEIVVSMRAVPAPIIQIATALPGNT